MTPRLRTEEEEKRRERERIKRIVALALPGQGEEALRLALETDLSVEQCATRLLAGATTAGRQASNGHARPGLWAAALTEAARRRLAR